MLLCEILTPLGYGATVLVGERGALDASQPNRRSERDVRADLFKGKRILVTGGGTGLGKVMMEKFVELGATASSAGAAAGCSRRRPGR